MKTFYTVTYSILGAIKPRLKVFDNLEKAREFASKDFTGFIVVHNCKNEETIKKYDKLMQE